MKSRELLWFVLPSHFSAPAQGAAVLNAVHQQQLLWPRPETMPMPLAVGTRPPAQSNIGQPLYSDSVGLADLVPSVAWPLKDYGEVGQHDGPTDGSSYFPVACNTLTNMSVAFPTVTNALNLVCWPARVCFYKDIIFKNLILEECPYEKKSTISDSLMGRQKREIFSRDLTVSLTRRLSLVKGITPWPWPWPCLTNSVASIPTIDRSHLGLPPRPTGSHPTSAPVSSPLGIFSEKTNLWVLIPFPS